MSTDRRHLKRKTDFQIISDWIAPGSRVLDLGCGRGILAEHLQQDLGCSVLGVDVDLAKIQACLQRRVNAYHGDILEALQVFPDAAFDWVVCSRTLQQLTEPQVVLEESLRVGKHAILGFINDAFWRNRWSQLVHGRRVINEVFPEPWHRSRPTNPVSVASFAEFCRTAGILVTRYTCLAGDWQHRQTFWPDLLAGYAIFELQGRGATKCSA